MICGNCGKDASTVINSRPSTTVPNGRRRRYRCKMCNNRWTTIEVEMDDEGISDLLVHRDYNDKVLKDVKERLADIQDLIDRRAIPKVKPVVNTQSASVSDFAKMLASM